MMAPGRWISFPGGDAKNVTFLARRRFDLGRVPATATVRVAADCRYVLYLNGTRVGFGPAKGSHKRYFYDSHEVTSLLRLGENHLAAEVHSPGQATFSAVPVQAALFVELEGIVRTDASWQVRPDPTRRGDSPIYTPQIGFSEWRDLRREPLGWQIFSDAPDDWLPALVLEGETAPGGRALVPRDVPALAGETHAPVQLVESGHVPKAGPAAESDLAYAKQAQEEPHEPATDAVKFAEGSLLFSPTASGDAYAIVDFARENFGSVQFEVEAPEGAILDLGYGDALYDGRVKTHSGSHHFADRYILRGGRQNIDHLLHDRGFRFLQFVIRRFDRPVRVRVTVTDRLYPLPARATFACDDSFLNRLWTMGAATLATCANDTFVDCPWREQALWLNDTLVVYPFFFMFTGDAVLAARCLRLAVDGQRANGLIPSVYPSAEVEHSTFPSMSAIWIHMLHDYYFYTGDLALVRELRPALERALSTYEAWRQPDGLVPDQPGMWNFIEWKSPGSRPGAPAEGTTSILNMLIASAYRAAASLFAAIDDSPRATELKQKEHAMVQAVIDRFWQVDQRKFYDRTNPPDGIRTSSQHPHAVGLHYDLLAEPYRSDALQALLDPSLIETDYYYQYFVLSALARGGHAAHALAVIRRMWGEMVTGDSPAIWETQLGKEEFGGVGSLCHAFACAPLHFMQTTILGVCPLRPGFAEFAIDPQSLGLKFARGTMPTSRGIIAVKWTRQEDGSLQVELDVPPSTTAVLPHGERLGPGHHAFFFLHLLPIRDECLYGDGAVK